MAMQLTSPAFQDGQPIPLKYTCEGDNVSHALVWTGAPPGTAGFVLINDDPDDDNPQPWVHWIAYNIPAENTGLPENVPPKPVLPDGTLQGTNSFGKTGYGGPCPPTGTHRYVFTLYALDRRLTLPPQATRAQLDTAMKDRILAQAQLTGIYQKQKR